VHAIDVRFTAAVGERYAEGTGAVEERDRVRQIASESNGSHDDF
jgi:hypothetical protein